MLSATKISNNEKVYAWLINREDKPFSCPECGDEVILKKCINKVDHFAHKPPTSCEFGQGESEKHRACKLEIYERLLKEPSVTGCEIEKYFESVRPDIFCYIRGIPVAIEVQISTLHIDQIIYRTIEYGRKGIYVLWLPLFSDKLLTTRYSPRLWEKWLHTTYFGRVYYWCKGLLLAPVHYDKHFIHIEERSWFDSDGNEDSGGGYDKLSIKFRTPKLGELINLVRDLKPLYRKPTLTPMYTVPEQVAD